MYVVTNYYNSNMAYYSFMMLKFTETEYLYLLDGRPSEILLSCMKYRLYISARGSTITNLYYRRSKDACRRQLK